SWSCEWVIRINNNNGRFVDYHIFCERVTLYYLFHVRFVILYCIFCVRYVALYCIFCFHLHRDLFCFWGYMFLSITRFFSYFFICIFLVIFVAICFHFFISSNFICRNFFLFPTSLSRCNVRLTFLGRCWLCFTFWIFFCVNVGSFNAFFYF